MSDAVEALDRLLSDSGAASSDQNLVLTRIKAELTSDDATALFRRLTTLATLLPQTDDLRMHTNNIAVLGGSVPTLIDTRLNPPAAPMPAGLSALAATPTAKAN